MKFFIHLFTSALIFFLQSCEPKPITQLSADDGIVRLRSQHSQQKWEQLIQDVNEYKSRYPYSKYASEANLLQADAYFSSKRFTEAIVQYEEFVKRTPSHPKAPLASFRVAQSQDKLSPEQIDRDQGYAANAIQSYSFYLEKYPNDPNHHVARERIKVLLVRLAENTLFIANFYTKKELFHAALNRYNSLLNDSRLPKNIIEAAKVGAARAYTQLAIQLEKAPKSDKNIEFINRKPDDLRAMAKKVLDGAKSP